MPMYVVYKYLQIKVMLCYVLFCSVLFCSICIETRNFFRKKINGVNDNHLLKYKHGLMSF